MRNIEWSVASKRDIRREGKGPNRGILNATLPDVLSILANDSPMPEKYQDHKLTGTWEGCHECHIRPNLLLIYEKPDDKTLRLVRLGSHPELFGM
jgi:mRNA interferase YafQ